MITFLSWNFKEQITSCSFTFLPHSEKAAQRICKPCLWIAQGDLKRLTSEFATFPVWGGPASSIQEMVAPKPTAQHKLVVCPSYRTFTNLLCFFYLKLIEHHLAIRKDPCYCTLFKEYIGILLNCAVGWYGLVVTCYSVTIDVYTSISSVLNACILHSFIW